MYKILQLTAVEESVLNEIIRIYKLPLEFCIGDTESDYFVDFEADINYNLLDGIYEILESINCDNGELYNKCLDYAQKSVFKELCNELGIDDSAKKTKILEKETEKVELQLPDERYKLVAEINETMPNHQEINITIEDVDGVVIQDIVRAEPTVSKMDIDNTEHKKAAVTVYLYEDEYNEDYTKKVDIGIYDVSIE